MIAATAAHTYPALCKIMSLPASDMTREAQMEIEAFFAECVADMDNESEKLLATLLLKALNKRVRSEFIGENIYLGRYETSQIQLFNILIEKFPFVRFSQQIVNEAIVEEMRDTDTVTLLDIGIGQGTQVLNIIEQAKALNGLRHLHIIGVEPYREALAKAETDILSCQLNTPFQVTFHGVAKGFEQVDVTDLGPLPGKVIVNASLALHHIQSDSQRMEAIGKVRQMNPGAFFLIEPNVDHYELDFFARFQHCYHHFYSIFQVIDRIENIDQKEKNALKLFFGREIEDIIGKEEKDRYEKHELASRWLERLRDHQFTIRPDLLKKPVEPGCGVEISYHKEGFLGFTFQQETVLAVMYAN